MIRSDITGIILAGGESRRMGTFKPLVGYRGKPLISWVFEALQPVCSRIIIIANSGDFSATGAAVFPDNFAGNGPAAGIEAGLSQCTTPLALICSCDTPNLTPEFFSHLIQNHGDHEISIAAHDGLNEPLIGVFARSTGPIFRDSIISGDPHPPRIIRKCRWQEIEITPDCNFWRPDLFLNLNTPLDLKR